METTNGGIVFKVVPFPIHRGGRDCYSIVGCWSGGRWAPSRDLQQIHVFKRGHKTVSGIWDVLGVESSTSVSMDAILIAARKEGSATIDPGDIIIFGSESTYTEVDILEADLLKPTRCLAVELGPTKLHAIIEAKDGRCERLVVFHSRVDTITPIANHIVYWRGKPFNIKLRANWLISDFEHLEMYFIETQVSVIRLLKILSPTRDFVLNVGQEMSGVPLRSGKGRKRPRSVYENFEPLMSTLAGSLKVRLHPAKPSQITFGLQPTKPLELLMEVFSAAESKQPSRIREVLAEYVTSLDEILEDVRKIAATAKKYGKFKITAGVRETLIEKHTEDVILSAIADLSETTTEVEGLLYAHDSHRYWFRLLTEDSHDWTIKYQESDQALIIGLVPRKFRAKIKIKISISSKDPPRRVDSLVRNGDLIEILPLSKEA
jgi:hypothetical protein